ncbi:putative MFS transporter [Xylariomycetidae sp. FL2044]|nr:putative MFS transporter [Xylariomycetidae sp. FL2044]
MSLAQHVTANEGVDREPDLTEDYDGEPLWRTISYDPVPNEHDGEVPAEELVSFPSLAAYEISTAKRVAQVVFGIVACWFAAGIVFGFASLKPILIDEGVYSDLCPPKSDNGGRETGNGDDKLPCATQDMRLNLFFIVASITCNASSLLAGWVLDRYGRRTCYVFSGVLMMIGCLLMGFAFQIPEFDGYLVANIFLSLGGTFLFVPSFQLANAFPKYSGMIVALVTGAFDGSAAIFLFYRLAWEATGGRFRPAHFFFGYAVVGALILLGEWLLMPAQPYHTTSQLQVKLERAQDSTEDVHDSDDELPTARDVRKIRDARARRRRERLGRLEELVGNTEERQDRVQAEEERQEASGIWGVLHGLPAHRQMLTPWFVFILFLTILQMLRMNYFIATIRAQYRFLLGSDRLAETINHFFDAGLPIGGVFATPFIGIMLNSMSVASMAGVLTVFIVVIGVFNCLPYLWAGYATVVAFVLFRPLYYSAISDYVTKVFGFATFGRLYGTITCVSGLFQFSQSGLDALTHGPLGNDPTPINIVMAVIGTLLALLLTIYVIIKGRAFREEQEEIVTHDDEQLPLIREESGEYGTTG